MKTLIITYYWPPAGGSGVQRWLKFVKYLRDFGIEPVVYTVENPDYAFVDMSLVHEIPKGIEVLKQPILEPGKLLSGFGGKQKQTGAGFLDANPGFFGKMIRYIRANYFIPDARKFWIKPSVKFLTDYLKKNPVDLLITTGPPHSMHLIGLGLKEKTGIKWLADFRDPWTEIDYFHQLPLSDKSKRKHLELEQKVLRQADRILVVGPTMKEAFKGSNPNIDIITNGYDSEPDATEVKLDPYFSITHIGMMNADRNPTVLWKVLSVMVREDPQFGKDLRVKLIGKIAGEVQQSIRKNQLESQVEYIDYLPHSEVKKYQQKAQVLLLAVNKVPSAKGIVTGKVFEYLEAQRPILAIAPEDGDLAEIIEKTRSGSVVGFKNTSKLEATLRHYYRLYKVNSLGVKSKGIEGYHRKALTEKLAGILRKIVDSRM